MILDESLMDQVRDVGDISNLLSGSGFIASSTDVIEAILAINTEIPEVKTDLFTFPLVVQWCSRCNR